MTTGSVVMAVSIALQLAAAWLALRLIPITGRRSAWVLLAAAAATMAVRRILLLIGDTFGLPIVSVISDASTILISILLIVGIARIEPIFRSWRRSEEAIRETEARYRNLVDSARDAIVTTDAQGVIVSVNPATAVMLGYGSTAEILGRNAAEFYVDQQERELAVGRLRSTGFVQNYEARLARPENPSRVVHVLANATLRRDDQRRVTGTEIIFTDITDWKRAEEASRQSEARLRAILDNSQTIVTLVDARGRILFESLAVTSVLGYAPEELIGRSTFDFIHPDDTLGAAERFRAVGHHPDAAGTMQFRFRHKDGTWRHLESFGRNLLHDPSIAAILVNSRDVSDRVQADEALRQSEKFHRSLLEQSFDGILVFGPDMNAKYRSPSIARIMGRPDANVGNALWRDDLHPGDYAAAAEAEAQLRTNPGKPLRMKLRVRRADSEYRLLEVQAVNLFHDPNVQGIVVNFRDITDEARLQEQLQRAQKMEGVGRLAGGVAHDFNNLLTVVMGAASLGLESAPRGGELRGHLQNILDYGRRASALTRRLLTFARRTAIEPKVVDLNVLIEDARKLIGSLIGEDVGVVMRAAQGLWPVKADPVQIEQVLVNLAVNARDAMPNGGTLTLETRNVTIGHDDEAARQAIRPGDYAVLTVTDTGAGMDAETRAHLFEPFFTTKGEKGTGLGLATCYGIVTQHGGMIACDSQAGAGSSFHVYLPRSVDTSDDAAVIPDAMRGRGERILVVEDEPLVLNVAVQSLRRYGYDVVPATGGAEALAAMEARGDEIDLVVTDVVMPGLSGQALGDSLRQRWPELKILFASGYAEHLPVNPTSLPPGTAFLAKPYTPGALAEKVREVLEDG